ncbi:MAG: hypothetical protein WCP98_04340 [Actinomycetes bacterium]
MSETITLQPIKRQTMRVRIVGDSPLICHRFGEKARKQMLDKQMKKAQQSKEAKVPDDDFAAARYITADGRDGFPAAGIKKAIANAFRFSDGMKKVEINGALHVQPGTELLPIDGPPPVMREDTVKISMGTTDIRFRPEYRDWSMEFDIVFNGRAISPEQIVNLVNIAGFGIGIGEWRPERSGQFGMFHVATEGEV